MTSVAFYAPMKSPKHPNPSGDRQIARSIMMALEIAGFSPILASEMRSLEMTGVGDTQAQLIRIASDLLPDLVARGRRDGWRLWLTYHNYYKAPDLLGPAVSSALDIPYVQIESTRARKRLIGPWSRFASKAEFAAEQANIIFFSTQRDAIALRDYAPKGQQLVHLHPFLDRSVLPKTSTRTGPILTAGMMRPGDKIESYKIIAEALKLAESDWQLAIAGDGTGCQDVEDLMAPFQDRVTFLGKLDAHNMERTYASARFFLWPGFNEAIGMVYLEAQAAGLAVIAQNRPGLINVLAPHLDYPIPDHGALALAQKLDQYWAHPPDPEPIRSYIQANHMIAAAAKTLHDTLMPLIQDQT